MKMAVTTKCFPFHKIRCRFSIFNEPLVLTQNVFYHARHTLALHLYSNVFESNLYNGKVKDSSMVNYEQRRYKRPLYLKRLIQPTRIIKFPDAGDMVQQETLDVSTVHSVYKDVKELNELPPELKQLFTLKFCHDRDVKSHRLLEMKQHLSNLIPGEMDLEYQIAETTIKIRHAVEHLLRLKKDNRAKHRISAWIEARRDLLTTLKEKDFERFIWILKELKIQYRPIPKDRDKVVEPKTLEYEAAVKTAADARKEKLENLKLLFQKERSEFEEYKRKTMEEIEAEMKDLNLTHEDIAKTIEETNKPPEPDVTKMSLKEKYFYDLKKRWEKKTQYKREIPSDLPPRPF